MKVERHFTISEGTCPAIAAMYTLFGLSEVGKTRAHANAPSLKPLNHRLSIVENYDPH
jgi:hypothetical protein